MEILYQHVGGIDVHKKQVTVTARTPDPAQPQVRWQTTMKFGTFYGQLLEMAAWLIVERGVTHVVMESTRVYRLPVYQALKEVGGASVCVWRWSTRRDAGGGRSAIGGSPRFDSTYLRLAAHTLARTAFCCPDSTGA